jgi:hypothetical protein
MSTTTRTRVTDRRSFDEVWFGGAVSGVIAGGAMAVVLMVSSPGVIVEAIPGLYGLSGAVAGWLVHLTHGAAFGAMFAALSLGAVTRRQVLGIGLALGVILWFVGAGSIMPIWLRSIGFAGASELAVPNLDAITLLAHLVYGAVIGLVFPFLADL